MGRRTCRGRAVRPGGLGGLGGLAAWRTIRNMSAPNQNVDSVIAIPSQRRRWPS